MDADVIVASYSWNHECMYGIQATDVTQKSDNNTIRSRISVTGNLPSHKIEIRDTNEKGIRAGVIFLSLGDLPYTIHIGSSLLSWVGRVADCFVEVVYTLVPLLPPDLVVVYFTF